MRQRGPLVAPAGPVRSAGVALMSEVLTLPYFGTAHDLDAEALLSGGGYSPMDAEDPKPSAGLDPATPSLPFTFFTLFAGSRR